MPGSQNNNGNGFMAEETRVNLGALNQRVLGLEQAFRGIGDQITSLSSKIDNSITAINGRFEERNKTPWPALSVAVSVLVIIGGILYWPIKDSQGRIEAAISQQQVIIGNLGEKFVTIRELDARSARARIDTDRMAADLRKLDDASVPRVEHAALQRQVDDIKKAFGDTFSLRDALQQLQRRIDQLEARPR